MKIPKSGKIYYALAGGSLFLTAGLIYLQKGGLDDLTEQSNQLEATAAKQKGSNQKLVDIQKEMVGLQTQLAHLEQGIPDSAYVPTMLRELEALGKSDNVEVAGLRPVIKRQNTIPNADKKNIDTKPYEPLDLELKGKANYADLLKFVTALNTFPKILEVRTLTITPGVGNADKGDTRLEVTMGLRAFLFKQSTDQKKEVAST